VSGIPSPTDCWTFERTRLRNWLGRNAPALEELYVGAVEMLFNQPVSGFTRFAAHAVREIRNRLPDVVAGPVGKRFDWKQRLDRLHEMWMQEGLSLDGPAASAPPLTGPPEDRVAVPRRVFLHIQTTLREHVDARERPAEAATRLWEALGIPAEDRATFVPVINAWIQVTDWFVGPSHNPKKSDAAYDRDEYIRNFQRFETILGALVGGFYPVAEGLDAILEDANA
jgi:hypothetical protein